MKRGKKIGYLGPEGTFSQEAVLTIAKNYTELIAFSTIINIFESLENGEIDEAVVPIENSTEGSVLITLDALTHFDVKIKKEIILPIQQNILVQKGQKLDNITLICSHQQALAQCRNYINKLGKQVHATESTANAARYVTEISTAAVIGSKSLAQKYNLEVIDTNIQDYHNNVTRFCLLSDCDEEVPTGNDKTSIIISLKDDKPGGLYTVLKEFATNKINLTKIESRPSKEGMGKYIFYIDFECHHKEDKIRETTTKLEEKVKFMKILGSYSSINVGGN